ncbi:MAG: DUF1801 domain-containing protein [Saprospiraceae bacterium]
MEKILRYVGKDIQAIDFNQWLEQKPAELRPIARQWFEIIKECGPDVQDIFHDNYPMVCVDNAPFAYVNVFKAHVNLGFFYGATLPDQSGLLEGSGKQGRHVKLRPGKIVHEKELLDLIRLAYLDIKQRIDRIA